jgi:hypothetical protein
MLEVASFAVCHHWPALNARMKIDIVGFPSIFSFASLLHPAIAKMQRYKQAQEHFL